MECDAGGGGFADYIWALPGIVIALGLSLAVRDGVGRALGVGRTVAWVLVFSLGVILAATLAPSVSANGQSPDGGAACDLSRVGLARVREYLRFGSPTLNVLLFMPLGAAVAWLPPSRRMAVVVCASIALPFAIELTQLVVTPLGRVCQGADVVDNLLGLAAGLGVGAVAALVRSRAAAGRRRGAG